MHVLQSTVIHCTRESMHRCGQSAAMILDRQLVLLFLLGALLSTMSSEPQPFSGGSSEWECTSNSTNIEYSVEKCNKTNKIILKVKITDDYVVNISQAAPPPIEAIPVTTEYVLSPFIFEPYSDPFEDSYEYIIQIGDRDHLSIPLPPKAVTEASSRSDYLPESEEQQDWNQFCLASQEEDDTPINLSDGEIHPKYHEILGVGYYRFHTKPRKWEEARQICEKEGAHLVIINTEIEADALLTIYDMCPNILHPHYNSYSYVGVHDHFMEGRFETIFGQPLDTLGYVKWSFGQPDNAHHFGENCVSMNRAGYFNDVTCTTELPYFCEHE